MNMPRFTVTHPVFTSMVMLIMVILGSFTLMRTNIDLMPELSLPTLTVITTYENASPEEIEELITKPIEEILAAIPGVETLSSTSREGQSVIRVSFIWGTDLDGAANDIRDGFGRIREFMPADADEPIMLKFDTNAFPVMILGIGSNLDALTLRKLIDDQIKFRLERLKGVAAINIWGGLEREIQVQIYPDKIRALRLSLDEVVQALRTANVTLPAGSIDRGNANIRIRIPGRFDNLDEIRGTLIANRGGPIYLHQIADVVDTTAKIDRKALVNGVPGVQLMVRKQSGYNTVEVTNRVEAEMEKIRRDFPQLSFVTVVNTGQYIQRAIDNLTTSLFGGAFLAFAILLFFLRNARAALLVATAMPISVLVAFVLIYFSGFTINMMTLGGLALGVGMMVDNAIVVLENIARKREEEGLDPQNAAIEGAQQIALAIAGGTFTTMVVFLPLIFAEGIAGEMFGQLGWVVSFSLIASLLVALTFTPMLASRLLSRQINLGNQVHGLAERIGRLIAQAETRYKRALDPCVRHPGRTLTATALLVLLSFALIPLIGTEFMPPSDESEVRVEFEMRPGTRLDVVEEKIQEISQIVRDNVPELKHMVVAVGPTLFKPEATSTAEMTAALIPVVERKRSSHEIADDLRVALADYPGGVLRSRAPQDVMLQMIGGGEALQVEIRGPDLDRLNDLADQIADAVETVPNVTDVRRADREGVPQVELHVDRAKTADLGVSVAQIARTLEIALGGTIASRYAESGDESNIVVKLKDATLLTVDEILDLNILNPLGQQITLRNLVNTEAKLGPIRILRNDQQRAIQIGANISGSDLGTVVSNVRKAIAGVPIPAGYQVLFVGEYEELRAAFKDLITVMILAIILVYIIMAMLYESLRDPLIVMFSVPLALIGVNLMLLLTGTTYNIVSLIGSIILIGVVVNNAILLVDQANHLRYDRQFALHDALLEAGRTRLRPILMTALTTMLALVPLAVAQGEGAQIQQSMSRALIGGLISSTFITLFVVPVIYTLFHRKDAAR
ncbi:efflux RND transporter permease subunit [Candidatus Macondimonas diazotrophica]|jgi:HAE1 family hydrophobic/amphiphilic exporter-1|uniref:Efflux RND transporter permease subunit n=1 Tax=Candidatus Macondimonas diazotrophica TaxID=2305248 RepID=A0A4Z0FAQ0_9GAMM|nr:efflux RND transporter permease subunit [Candidatus Macondimonas diazotrophica]NCU00666.1 efflux RND transporter permease subunit [Candidatus Macondimonas diazotrophica]TFZ83540.1 efflux RND transporter permease subunit [Candidatus Macondimonas diazotrophica]HBG50613.1 acriflavin resistance protein [Gammaproteobacteria bacterium]